MNQQRRNEMINELINNSQSWSEKDRRCLETMPANALEKIHDICLHGGPGSGNFGHAGIPGQVGGSSAGEGGGSGSSGKVMMTRAEHDAALPLTPEDQKTFKGMEKKWSVGGVTLNPKTDKEKALAAKMKGKKVQSALDSKFQAGHDQTRIIDEMVPKMKEMGFSNDEIKSELSKRVNMSDAHKEHLSKALGEKNTELDIAMRVGLGNFKNLPQDVQAKAHLQAAKTATGAKASPKVAASYEKMSWSTKGGYAGEKKINTSVKNLEAKGFKEVKGEMVPDANFTTGVRVLQNPEGHTFSIRASYGNDKSKNYYSVKYEGIKPKAKE